ncbi:hypothetical protein ABZ714_15095 [Streptomyces sp. NPDC006798]|uniref:hypothetical protein n=1 Tax=Streptomyces sp. NPDC006798 TaxID=3155462 RepID=UPI0033F2BF70
MAETPGSAGMAGARTGHVAASRLPGAAMGWGYDDGLFVLWWLLGFAAVHAALGLWRLLGGLPDRAVIRRIEREGIGPVEAAQQSDGDFTATLTALLLLAHQGAVTVADDGAITAVPGVPEPSDPVLAALLDGLRRRGSAETRFHDVRDAAEFTAYRDLLAERKPQVRWFAEPCQTVIGVVSFVVTIGVTVQGMANEVPLPLLGWEPGFWMVAILPIWWLLWATALAWPGEYSRRWRRFNRFCRARAGTAVADVPPRIRSALLKGAVRPGPPRPPRREPGSANGRPDDGGGDWADAYGADSCGGGCGD